MKTKQHFQRFFASLLLLVVSLSWAYGFEVGDICYFVNSDGKSVTVTRRYEHYEGDIIIPSTVTYNDVEYTVTSIDCRAFNECSITSVTIPESVTSIDIAAFYGCRKLTSVTIPNSVTSLGRGAFWDCTRLTSITIGNGVTKIETSTFLGCSSLTSVTIPNSVTSIEDNAFSGCSSLTSITIPSSVKSIGSYAFVECRALTSFKCKAVRVPKTGYCVFDHTPQGSATLYVPKSSVNAYKAAEQWRNFKSIRFF